MSLARIDPRLIEAARNLDRRELNLLMALSALHLVKRLEIDPASGHIAKILIEI